MNVYLLISVTVLLGLCSCEPVFDITDPAFIEECVREHNKHRSNVNPTAANMRYMGLSFALITASIRRGMEVISLWHHFFFSLAQTWDEGLAVTARAWARFCVFKHNIYLREVRRVHPTFTSVGENIWAGTPYSSFKPESAVKSWKDEDKDYNYDTKNCTKVCGHYTQIVWADSYKVGCAAQVCLNGVAETSFSTKPGIIFVCNYATAGNYRGASPYRRGEPCSGCKQETCANNLCQNSTRDALQSYNWTPDWDPSPSSCASGGCDYQTHILVLLMFACVYGLQHLYNLFEYE